MTCGMKDSQKGGVKKRSDNAVLQKKIEDAIRNSLDPLSAQRALESLNPLFQDLSGLDGKHQAQNKKSISRDGHHQRDYNDEDKKNLRFSRRIDPRVTLPSIQTILHEYRNAVSPAINVQRRSISEPVPVSAMYPTGCQQTCNLIDASDEVKVVNQNPTVDQCLNRKTPEQINRSKKDVPYNSDAAIALLRLERNARKTDFSTFWDWKKEKSTDGSVEDKKSITKVQLEREIKTYMDSINDCNNKKVLKVEKIQRETNLEKVKRRQLAYRSQMTDENSGNNSLGNTQQISTSSSSTISGSKSHQYPSGTCSTQPDDGDTHNGDQYNHHNGNNITDFDMTAVSKYFSTNDEMFSESQERRNSFSRTKNRRKLILQPLESCSGSNSHEEHSSRIQQNVLGEKDAAGNKNKYSVLVETNDNVSISSHFIKDGTQNESQQLYHSNYAVQSTKDNFNVSLKLRTHSSSSSPSPTSALSQTLSPKCSTFGRVGSKDLLTLPMSSKNVLQNVPQTVPQNVLQNIEEDSDLSVLSQSRNIGTPSLNDFSLGGLEGLLDWTRNLDLDLI